MMIFNHNNAHLSGLRKVLSYAVMPAQYMVDWPSKLVIWTEERFTKTQILFKENQGLRTKVLLLKAALQKQYLLEKENAQLRALLQSTPKPEEHVLVAQLLAIDPDPFAQQVILNKGSKQGVYLGQPVVDGYGVFGQVIQLGTLTSRVLLITDTQSAVPIEDKRSGIRGVVVGKGVSKQLSLIHIPATANIQVGDVLVTSGLGGKFPEGYPVGTISSIEKSPGQEFVKVSVKPTAQINRSHLVLLVWPQYINKKQQRQAQVLLSNKHSRKNT